MFVSLRVLRARLPMYRICALGTVTLAATTRMGCASPTVRLIMLTLTLGFALVRVRWDVTLTFPLTNAWKCAQLERIETPPSSAKLTVHPCVLTT